MKKIVLFTIMVFTFSASVYLYAKDWAENVFVFFDEINCEGTYLKKKSVKNNDELLLCGLKYDKSRIIVFNSEKGAKEFFDSRKDKSQGILHKRLIILPNEHLKNNKELLDFIISKYYLIEKP